MHRFVWLRADEAVGPWERRAELIEAAAARGIDGIVVDGADVHRVRPLFDGTVVAFNGGDDATILEVDQAEGPPGDVHVVGKGGEGDGTVDRPTERDASGDLSLLGDLPAECAAYVSIDGEAGATLARWAADVAEYVIVTRPDWEVIPLENLIADVGREAAVVAAVDGPEAAKTAFETLERGADGVVLETDAVADIEETIAVRDGLEGERLELTWATVTEVARAGMADRVCVDTGTMLDPDEGLLVGSLARGLAFVHAETADGPYTNPRPFRVNAGAVHAYALVPDGETRYLSELGSGDRVLVTDLEGHTRDVVVGRVKIERRPMVRVALDIDDDAVEVLAQEAETVRLHVRDGGAVAVTDLEAGMEVALYYADVPRHFGTAVEDERLIER